MTYDGRQAATGSIRLRAASVRGILAQIFYPPRAPRHAALGSPTQSGGTRRKFLGQPTYLEAKAKGESSMSVKRLRPKSVVGPVPQGPRDMVKAGLPEPQSQAVIRTLAGRTLEPRRHPLQRFGEGNRRTSDGWAMTDEVHIRERMGHLQSRSDVQCHRNAGLPTGHEPYGNGAVVVVRGRESRPHGEGWQVVKADVTVRYS